MSVSDCPPDVQVKRRASQTAPPEPVPAEYRRCTKKSCTWCIHETSTYKLCHCCRDRIARYFKTDKGKAAISRGNKSEAGKAAQRRYNKTEKGKANRKRVSTSEKRKAAQAAWRKTPNGRAYIKKNSNSVASKAAAARHQKSEKGKLTKQRYQQTTKGRATDRRAQTSEKGKARRKRYNKEIMNQLTNSLYHMVVGKHQNPQTFPRMGVFSSNADARQHFQLHFAPWMSFDNQGVYEAGMGYNVKWQIGHGIPKKAYDPTNDEDLLKCWSRDNLRPQCARENNELRDRLPSHDWLNARSHLWPASWGGRIPGFCD